MRVLAGIQPVVHRGDGFYLINPTLGPMSREEALHLAAWLIVLADPDAAAHVRAGPIGIGAEFVALLREIVAR